MPMHMEVGKTADTLRIANGGTVTEHLFSLQLDTSGMTGTDESKLRAVEAKFQAALQASMEITTKRSDLSHDDPEWQSDSAIIWPRRRQGNFIIERVTTVEVHCRSIDPDGIVRDFLVLFGDGHRYQTLPTNWWKS